MIDFGQIITDQQLKRLERDLAKEYKRATLEATKKLEKYLERTERQRQQQFELYKAGKITRKDYIDWCFRHNMIGKRWREMRDVLAMDFANANKIALAISKQRMPDIYALNANYCTYQIEHDGRIDTGFTLYNHDAAEYLLSEERQLMPGPSKKKAKEIAANKDLQWNMRKVQSAVLQGVLQGESPYEVARRLMRVGEMNYNSAVRYARTMTTNAQNAGRYEAFRRADRLGVDLTIEWQATLDGRTRHEHRMMHGQRRKVGEPFEVEGVKILWPAQPNYDGSTIPQEQIWNCRCTLLSWVKGFEGDTVKSSPKMGDMSFEDWLKAKPVYDTQADREQFERYKKTLGKAAPKSFSEFQRIKYREENEWKLLKSEYRFKNNYNKRGLNHKPVSDNSAFKPISEKTFNALVAGAKSQGAVIIKGGEWARQHLVNGIRASSIGNWLVFGDNVSKSDVHEELRHFWQWRTGFAKDAKDYERSILCEIDAKNYLIINRRKLKIPRAETLETMRELEAEREKLRLIRELYK